MVAPASAFAEAGTELGLRSTAAVRPNRRRSQNWGRRRSFFWP